MDPDTDLVSSIEETLTQTESWLNGLLETLGWSREHILDKPEKVQCPNDAGHFVPEDRLARHLEFCELLKRGYTKQELEDERRRDSSFFYEKAANVVRIELDEETIRNVISRTARSDGDTARRRLPATMSHVDELTPSERLALYQFCVDTAVAAKKPTTIPVEELQLLEPKQSTDDRPKSILELKAEERDMKRRRASYRGKSVHTANKSYTEVIRDVIQTQCELLQEKWKSELGSPVPRSGSERKSEHDRKSDRDQKKKRSRPTSSDEMDKDDERDRHKQKKHKKHKKHKSEKR